MYGRLIKAILITAAGREGISLKNVRHVHILEPYWNSVALDQIIGRARRICSHIDMPEKYRTVQVYMYLMTLTETQLAAVDDEHSTDGELYLLSQKKKAMIESVEKLIRAAAIDCKVHNYKEVKCAVASTKNEFQYEPDFRQERRSVLVPKNVP